MTTDDALSDIRWTHDRINADRVRMSLSTLADENMTPQQRAGAMRFLLSGDDLGASVFATVGAQCVAALIALGRGVPPSDRQ